MYRPLVNITSITLPNLIARQRILPECLVVSRPERDVRAMTAVVDEWLGNPLSLARTARELSQAPRRDGESRRDGRTAEYILSRLGTARFAARRFARAA